MTFPTLDQLQKISILIRACGLQAQRMSTEQFQVFAKGKDDYVTTIDRALDQRLTAGFAELFPQDGVITEENAQSWQTALGNFDRLWLIDPLDGTDDFIAGQPDYAVMAGLLQAFEPLLGWVYAPAYDQLYWGGKELGLFQAIGGADSVPLAPVRPAPATAEFCSMLLGQKDQRRFGAAIQQQLPGVQFDCVGSFGLKVMRVVCGQAGLYVYLNGRVKLWDTTGPIALARKAGLICCDLDGNPLKFTPDAFDHNTLVHQQPIIVGWPDYVEMFRSRLQKAVLSVKFP